MLPIGLTGEFTEIRTYDSLPTVQARTIGWVLYTLQMNNSCF